MDPAREDLSRGEFASGDAATPRGHFSRRGAEAQGRPDVVSVALVEGQRGQICPFDKWLAGPNALQIDSSGAWYRVVNLTRIFVGVIGMKMPFVQVSAMTR